MKKSKLIKVVLEPWKIRNYTTDISYYTIWTMFATIQYRKQKSILSLRLKYLKNISDEDYLRKCFIYVIIEVLTNM